jgi:hypothetical protein
MPLRRIRRFRRYAPLPRHFIAVDADTPPFAATTMTMLPPPRYANMPPPPVATCWSPPPSRHLRRSPFYAAAPNIFHH